MDFSDVNPILQTSQMDNKIDYIGVHNTVIFCLL